MATVASSTASFSSSPTASGTASSMPHLETPLAAFPHVHFFELQVLMVTPIEPSSPSPAPSPTSSELASPNPLSNSGSAIDEFVAAAANAAMPMVSGFLSLAQLSPDPGSVSLTWYPDPSVAQQPQQLARSSFSTAIAAPAPSTAAADTLSTSSPSPSVPSSSSSSSSSTNSRSVPDDRPPTYQQYTEEKKRAQIIRHVHMRVRDIRSLNVHLSAMGLSQIQISSTNDKVTFMFHSRERVQSLVESLKRFLRLTPMGDGAFVLAPPEPVTHHALYGMKLPEIERTSSPSLAPIVAVPIGSPLQSPPIVVMKPPPPSSSPSVVPSPSSTPGFGPSTSSSSSHGMASSAVRGVVSNVLTGFAKVTSFARDATSTLLAPEPPPPGWFFEPTNGTVYTVPPPGQRSSHQRMTPDILEDEFEVIGELEVTAEDILKQEIAAARSKIERRPRSDCVTPEEWIVAFDQEGRIARESWDALKRRIYSGGVDPSIRAEVWKYLLHFYPLDSTLEQREQLRKLKETEYMVYRTQWQSVTPEQEANFTKLRSRKHKIDKDVVRTDRSWEYYEGENNPNLALLYNVLVTYTFYNFDLGYVQGMNDLVSVILIVMESDEVATFWCFKGLMDRMQHNFDKDQAGMHKQLQQLSMILKYTDCEFWQYLQEKKCLELFFCFRWLLIMFKREFPLPDVQQIWEVIWTDYKCDYHHLFVTLAMLLRNRDRIMTERMKFDDILKYLNELSMTMDGTTILMDAEYYYELYLKVTDAKMRNEIENLAPVSKGIV